MKPQPQMNLLYQQVLGQLLANPMITREEWHLKKGTPVKVEVPVPALAGHVSWDNCNRAARRWAPA